MADHCRGCLQVLTSTQVAQVLIHAFPHVTRIIDMLEVLATMMSEPSKEAVMAAAEINPMTAEWTQFLAYCEMVLAIRSPDYMPMSACPLVRECA